MDESRRVERELVEIQERQQAGDIYIRSLLTDLQTAETEGEELQVPAFTLTASTSIGRSTAPPLPPSVSLTGS